MIKRLYTRVPEALYHNLEGMAKAGGYRSVHSLVRAYLEVLVTCRRIGDALRKDTTLEDEVKQLFDEYTNAEAPEYGVGKKRIGHREP